MADNALEKIKEQYLETITHVVPLTQAIFLVVMTVMFDQLHSVRGKPPTVILAEVSLGKIFDKDSGYLWNASLLMVIVAFVCSLLNVTMLNFAVRQSFIKSKVGAQLGTWKTQAQAALSTVTPLHLPAMQTSLQNELEKRQKKYKSIRLFADLIFSLGFSIIYGALFAFFSDVKASVQMTVSYCDVLILLLALLMAFGLHRFAIKYAISKLIPIQVFLSASTGNLVFIEGIN